MSDDTTMGVLDIAFWLMIAWVVLAYLCKCNCSCPEEDTLPVYHSQQHQPVYTPPPLLPPPSQSYRPSPYTPLLHQPGEERQPVSQPPPRRPPLSQSYRPSLSTPLLHQLEEERQPVSQPPPRRPPLSPSYRPSPSTPLLHQPEEERQPVSQPPPRRPPPSQSHQSSSQSPPSPPGPPKYEVDDQADRTNEDYIDLRERANKEGNEMARCFSESHDAYDRGDRAAAKELSNQGKNHKQKMEQLHKAASTWIYLEKNRGRPPGEIDLHGLYVKEAIAYTDTALEEAKLRGDSELRLIVGKGSHSEGGVAKVRLAIEELMRKYQLVAELDPLNSVIPLSLKRNLYPHTHRRETRKRTTDQSYEMKRLNQTPYNARRGIDTSPECSGGNPDRALGD
ncbi:hypothetical protein F5146DRAFT_1006309 [Armillaria mellea]|nr:hypothetical protein F5146DRAFT_1006309 [Armillaria mellea]